jgi:hypothetical protein
MPTMSARLSYKRSTVSRLVAAEDIEAYWEKYTQIFPEERETLWDNLLEGLNRYHQLLKGESMLCKINVLLNNVLQHVN